MSSALEKKWVHRSKKALVVMDNFSGQTTTTILEKIEEQGIVVVRVPPGTTDRLQPLDVSINKLSCERSSAHGMLSNFENSLRQA